MSRWSLVALLVPVVSIASEPYSTAPFAPGRSPAPVAFEGRLTITMSGLEVHEIAKAPFIPEFASVVPPLEMDLVTSGADLIPANRGLIVTESPIFDYFVSPGRVWSDGVRARASLPFALVDRFGNCAHNGLLAFSFTATAVDDVKVLVNQETCHFLKFDLWGAPPAFYARRDVANADAIRNAFAEEQSHRLASAPIDAFAKKYGADVDALLAGLPKNDDLTTAGVYVDGIRYTTGCSTRNGPYPYCDAMLHTSFSTAKSAFPALVLMALAQRYGLAVYDEKIIDWVPEARGANGDWKNVTFGQVGDMTSGNFTNGEPLADAVPGNFYFDLDRAGKLAAALSWPNGAPAGTRFVYQTADTFILVDALDHWLVGHETGFDDSFRFLVETVLKPLHVAPEVQTSRRTRDGGIINSGTAFGGMGMFWTADALVKVAKLMAIDGGRIDARQVLHPQALAATLQRDANDRGMETHFFGSYYNNGMWASRVQPIDGELACAPWVPFMTGLSGVRAMLMPNEVIFYYFNDAQAFPLVEAVRAIDRVRPLCASWG